MRWYERTWFLITAGIGAVLLAIHVLANVEQRLRSS